MPSNVDAVILAAGGSTRFGEPKQLLVWEGESLIRRAVRAAERGGCARVALVVGEMHGRITAELKNTSADFVPNLDWALGLGTSIRCGLEHLLNASNRPEAVVLLACDQPFVDATIISGLLEHWKESGKAIVASRYAETLGIPALFDRSCFEALLQLPDNSGAKVLFAARPGDVAAVEFEAGALDIDTPTDYARAQLHRSKERPRDDGAAE
jgi:molybdenum cofactor cytidylyltransferase